MPCRLDHSDPEVIPEFLCCGCHPERIPTAADNERFYAELREEQRAAEAEAKLERDIYTTRREVDKLMARDPHPESTQGKILAGLQNKLARLEGLI